MYIYIYMLKNIYICMYILGLDLRCRLMPDLLCKYTYNKSCILIEMDFRFLSSWGEWDRYVIFSFWLCLWLSAASAIFILDEETEICFSECIAEDGIQKLLHRLYEYKIYMTYVFYYIYNVHLSCAPKIQTRYILLIYICIYNSNKMY